ncbi:MAG: hypothetical protein P4L68_12395 [Methylovirgula sp.]|nr:hypothetical protein [Methylovirgula sp.]
MEIYIIVCKLRSKHVYESFCESVKALSDAWWHCGEPTWLIRSSLKPQQIKTKLAPHMQSDEQLLILACKDTAVWDGFDDVSAMWLKTAFRQASARRSGRQSPNYAAE